MSLMQSSSTVKSTGDEQSSAVLRCSLVGESLATCEDMDSSDPKVSD